MPVFGKRRALGQHFLRDRGVIDKIARTAVEEASAAGCQALLEVGPGKGAITRPLMELLVKSPMQELILAERDRVLAADWRSSAETHALKSTDSLRIRVEEGDFVTLPEERWLGRWPLAVASNLPYSAGTAILIRLARHVREIPVMVLMFQAEVAQRLRAEPATKSWGSLSIWIQNQWDVTRLCSVPPGAFTPPPDVDSEVVVLRRRASPRVQVGLDARSQELWDGLLKASFLHRRKMLRSGLPSGSPYREALVRSGIAPTLRAEELSWEDWARFYSALK